MWDLLLLLLRPLWWLVDIVHEVDPRPDARRLAVGFAAVVSVAALIFAAFCGLW